MSVWQPQRPSYQHEGEVWKEDTRGRGREGGGRGEEGVNRGESSRVEASVSTADSVSATGIALL